MYYVNEEQIRIRLEFLPTISAALRRLSQVSDRDTYDVVHGFAEERALHLAIEAVTDIGSLLIDKFIMRDAGGYEDIIDIIHTEGVIPDAIAADLREFVAQRKALTQNYMQLDRSKLRPSAELIAVADLLDKLPRLVEDFIAKEMEGFIAPGGPKS
jgi:uncharacterized protein YutE (UPF0331/DUF86 family)